MRSLPASGCGMHRPSPTSGDQEMSRSSKLVSEQSPNSACPSAGTASVVKKVEGDGFKLPGGSDVTTCKVNSRLPVRSASFSAGDTSASPHLPIKR